MPSLNFPAARKLSSVLEVLEMFGWQQTAQVGAERYGPCPVHKSTHARSDCFATNGLKWFCHKCKAHGDALDLYAALRGLPLFEATVELLRKLGRPIPWLPRQGARFRRPRDGGEER